MAINWTDAQIEEIIKRVVSEIGGDAKKEAPAFDSESYNGRKFIGIFEDMNDAIEAAQAGYKAIRSMRVEEREKLIAQIRKMTHEEAEIMARIGVAETKMGRVDHKTAKHHLVADKTPGTEDLVSQVKTGDCGLTLTEMAPFGVVGSITPSTNPSETVICNSMGMIAAGNGIVFNPHPNAIATSNYAVDLINRACFAAGGPKILVASVKKPTLDTANIMYKSPLVRLLVCTGGPGVVKAVLASGKKALGAGAGNPPVIVNLPCIAEKEVFAFDNIADELIAGMQKNGAYKITAAQADELSKIVLVDVKNPKTGIVKKTVSRDCVGRDAKVLLAKIGVNVGDDIRCIICETGFDHLFVQEELMMPILPIVRVKNIDEAIEKAVAAEHGNRHTAHMHSKNIDHLTRFARAVETTIFVKNAPSYAGIGFGGEGHTTFTIAGPTGEGITSAKSFTRLRRCVMADNFRII